MAEDDELGLEGLSLDMEYDWFQKTESPLVKSFMAAAEKAKINFEGAEAIYANLRKLEKGEFNGYAFTVGKRAKSFAKELEQQLHENGIKNVKVVADTKKGEVKLLYLRVTIAKEPEVKQTEKPYGEPGSIERAVYDAAVASSFSFYDIDGKTPARASMGNIIKSINDFFTDVRENPGNPTYLKLPVGDKKFAENLEAQLRPIFEKEGQPLKLDGVAIVMGKKAPRVTNVSF